MQDGKVILDVPLEEERELARCREALARKGVGPGMCVALEDLICARIARALRAHCDADHDIED